MTQVADRQVNELVTIIRPSFVKITQDKSVAYLAMNEDGRVGA